MQLSVIDKYNKILLRQFQYFLHFGITVSRDNIEAE